MNIGMVMSQAEPYQSLVLQRIEGGFVLLSPPDRQWIASDPLEAAQIIADWLGATPPHAGLKWVVNAAAVQCPLQSQFSIVRTRRGRVGAHGFVVTYHVTDPTTTRQRAIFNGIDVMETLMQWAATPGPKRQHEHQCPHGVRLCLLLDPSADDVFLVKVTPGNAALAATLGCEGEPTWLVAAEEPELTLGVTDPSLTSHFKRMLGDSPVGYFTARYEDGGILAIGQRIADDDVEDED